MKWIVTIILVFNIQQLLAQHENYYFEKYTTRDGLSHNSITCLFKDSRNLLWVGTDFGLNMYDGNTFTCFFHIAGDTNSLVHNKILSIAEDAQQNLWIGTQSGVSCFNLLTKKFINYSRQKKGTFFLDIEHCFVYPSHDGTIWIGHNKGIVRLNPSTHQHRSYSLLLSPPGEYRNRYVSDFLEDEKNNLWLATSLGVFRLKKGDTAFQSFRFPHNFPYETALNACTHFAQDKHGTIYCGTWNGGIIVFDPSSRQFKPLDAGTINGNSVFDIFFDEKITWVTTTNGVYNSLNTDLAREKGSWNIYKPENFSNSLDASGILPDNHSMWMATGDGLVLLKTTGAAITNFSFSNINNWSPLSIVESRPGELVICNGLALMNYNLNEKKATKILDLSFPSQLSKKTNGYWLTARPGLYRFDKNLQIQETITLLNPANVPELFGSVYEDRGGIVWMACGRTGIRQYDTKTKKWTSFFDNTETSIRQIVPDRYGNIWFAFSLMRYDENKKTFEKITIKNPFFDSTEVNSVTSIYPTQNFAWIGTYAGIYYYDYKQDSVFNIPLPSNISPRINGLVADKNDHLWFESNGSVVMYDIGKKNFKVLNESDGFTGKGISSRFTVLENGNIAIGYDGGFCLIDPSKIQTTNTISTPEFISITIDEASVADLSVSPVLRYNQSISFGFVSPSYNVGQKNQYAYQLQPIDNEWKPIGNNTMQRFVNLPPGKYTFIVKAADASGIWNEKQNSFSFIVRPPFWKTWWFVSLCILLIGSILYTFYRYRLKQLLKMEKMRTRIATDLHDDIGATLSSISMYSDAVKEQVKIKLPHLEPVLEKMGENSRTMVGSMSDIVWAINPDNDEGEKLILRMESYTKDLCALKNVRLQFNVDEKINTLKLSLEQRKNIYLIFKESINNALKYSDCTQIEAGISIHNKYLVLRIKDNGKGFDMNNKKGNGLRNMEMRVAEIRGLIKIQSSEEAGTELMMSCPIA